MRCLLTSPRANRSLWSSCLLASSLLVGLTITTQSQNKKSSVLQEDFPFQGAAISAKGPGKNVAMKGLAIRVANGASVLFDTELLRMVAG